VTPDPRRELIGAHLLGLLDPDELRTLQTRLAADADYRREMEELQEMTRLLAQVPPEALLDGPAEGELVLQRALRQIRTEGAARRRRRLAGLAAVAAVAVAVLLGGGVLVGRATAPPAPTGSTASTEIVVAQPGAPAPGGRTMQGRDGDVTMVVTITPAAGWVRVTANVAGVPAGQRCHLVVLARDGSRAIAAGWVASPAGEHAMTTLNGSASVAAQDVAAVLVENEAGRRFMMLPA